MAYLSSGFLMAPLRDLFLSRQDPHESICSRDGAMAQGIQHGLFESSFGRDGFGDRSTHGGHRL